MLKEHIHLAKPKNGAPPFCFVCLFVFCWLLLIWENTLIQVVKFKKKKILTLAESRTQVVGV